MGNVPRGVMAAAIVDPVAEVPVADAAEIADVVDRGAKARVLGQNS